MKSCPIPACCNFIPDNRLMCAAHWQQVPEPLQKRAIQAKRHARQYGTAEWTAAHVQAQEAAIAAVSGQREAA